MGTNGPYIDKLFSILRSALWGGSPCEKLSAEEFKRVMILAEQQTVTGLVFDALKNIPVDEDADVEILTSSAITEQIMRTNTVLNKELVRFTAICKENNISYIVVKGQVVGSLYPNPLLRVSGDIDFLVNDDYAESRVKIENAFGVLLPRIMLEKQVPFNINGVKYELHTSLRTWLLKKHQRCWDKLVKEEWQTAYYVEIGNQRMRTLSPTTNVAYIFVHLFFHFIREGISLRQFCDWAMTLHNYHDVIDSDKLKQILKELAMYKPFRTFGAILIDELGLPKEEFPFVVSEKERKWKNKILSDVFTGGNFGKLNHKARSTWRFKSETMKVAVRNSCRYGKLSPIEAGLIIPRLIIGNVRILLKKVFMNRALSISNTMHILQD